MSGTIAAAQESAGKAASIAIRGRITVSNSGEMKSDLAGALAGKPAILSVDLSGVSYLDTSGLATLLQAAGLARSQGTQFRLKGIQEQPRYLFEITHLDRIVEIEAQEPGK